MLRMKENVTNDSKSYEWKKKSYEWKKKSYEWKKKVTNERKKVTNERKKGYERREKKCRRKRKKVTNEEKEEVTNEEKKKVTNEQKKRVTNEEKKKEATNEEKKRVTNEEKKEVTNEEKKKGYEWREKRLCLGCLCTVLLCCLITWATHSHPFRAPVYCGCQPGPTGVLIHPGRAVDQRCANPLAAALMLHCTELDTCVRVRPYWTCCHKHTPSVECTCRESRPIRPALCRTVHLQSELVGGGIFHIPCHARWAIYLQNQLVIFVAITRVTVHLVNTIAGSTRIKPTIINDLAHLFHLLTTSIWKSEV